MPLGQIVLARPSAAFGLQAKPSIWRAPVGTTQQQAFALKHGRFCPVRLLQITGAIKRNLTYLVRSSFWEVNIAGGSANSVGLAFCSQNVAEQGRI